MKQTQPAQAAPGTAEPLVPQGAAALAELTERLAKAPRRRGHEWRDPPCTCSIPIAASTVTRAASSA